MTQKTKETNRFIRGKVAELKEKRVKESIVMFVFKEILIKIGSQK